MAEVADRAWESMVTVGRVVRPHGNRGHVVVAPDTDFGHERFRPGAALHVLRDGHAAPLDVIAGREQDGRWIVGFAGVTTIDAAEALRGQELRIPADALQPTAPGAFYVHDLIGCRVTTAAGQLVGTVERVQLDAGTPLLAVRSATGEVLVPLAEDICREVDVTGKRIVIDAPDGLIDLNR
ncbi:MAG TPA: ribosome maturation factor RimM [Vicinamibacterales bacterium]|nr:ribosome maturation factor RimM [Vicinamibacterales bacterium]